MSRVAQRHQEAAQIALLPREEEPLPDIAPIRDALITAPTNPEPPRPPPVATYKVENQDSLGQLCRLVYGICSRNMVQKLAAANPTIDPEKLVTGQTVYLPVIENLKPVVP
jgi:hypothetical protein